MEQAVVLISGAGRGIGRATAIELARRGYRLALVARTQSELEETRQLVGGEAVLLPADVTSVEQVDQLVAQALDRLGRIDALVNSIGLAPQRSVEQMTTDEWRQVIDTNLSAVFYLCRAVWPAFRRQGSGVIVNLSSLACRDPFPGFAAYGTAKAGLNLFGLALAREGAPIGVRVHTLALGAVETAMFRQLRTPQQYPRDKTLDPAEVAAVIAQCVSGELRYTSGEVVFLHKGVS